MLVFHIYLFGRCFNIHCIKGIFYKFPGIKPMILALAPWSTLWTVEIQSQFKKKECISISGQPSPFNFNGIWLECGLQYMKLLRQSIIPGLLKHSYSNFMPPKLGFVKKLSGFVNWYKAKNEINPLKM